VEAKTRHFGSVGGAEADLTLVTTPTARALARALRGAAPLLGPIDPPDTLGATLSSRLRGIPGLEPLLDRYRATLPRPRLEPAWPLPDQPDLDRPSATSGHTGSVTSCAFSPDGTTIVTTGDDCTTRLWTADGTQLAVLTGHNGGVWNCAYSPDGTLLATASDDHTARLWQTADRRTLTILAGHTDWVADCAFSPTARCWPPPATTAPPDCGSYPRAPC
jgi:WD domain, G-beta repeat